MTRTAGIYSFPKSGNTWLRAILAGLFDNRLSAIPGLHDSKLEDAETALGWRFYKWHGKALLQSQDDVEFKTHKVIHIRRNPLDVFLSYLNFLSGNVKGKASFGFPNVDAIVGTDLFEIYFHTFLHSGHLGTPNWQALTGTYFSHNQTWLDRAGKAGHIQTIRYEDLVEDPVQTLGFLQDWLGLSQADLMRLVENGQQNSALDGKFFWKQKVGNFCDYLTDAQIDLFLKYRLSDCAALGYDAEFWSKTRNRAG